MAAHLRLTPAFFHILLSVVNNPQHGYAIMQQVEERTRGAVRLGPGSLYWAIKRLVDAGFLEEVTPSDSTDGRKRSYALTTTGRAKLRDEVQVLADIVGYAESQRLIGRSKALER